MLSLGDNMSTNSWVQKINTPLIMRQNALRLFVEYSINSKVVMSTDHISSKANIIADTLSCVNELFVPKISYIWCSLSYSCTTGLFQIHRDEIVADFPSKSRIPIRSELGIVVRILNGDTKKKSELRTIFNHRIHFLWYCKQQKLLDRIFL